MTSNDEMQGTYGFVLLGIYRLPHDINIVSYLIYIRFNYLVDAIAGPPSETKLLLPISISRHCAKSTYSSLILFQSMLNWVFWAWNCRRLFLYARVQRLKIVAWQLATSKPTTPCLCHGPHIKISDQGTR